LKALGWKILVQVMAIGYFNGQIGIFYVHWVFWIAKLVYVLFPVWYVAPRKIWQPWWATLTCTYQGSMLWSQFSAIFDNFRRKNWRFSQKPMLWLKFLQKLAVVWAKNANIFAKFFAKNI
jgi:hypothetical protein